MSLFEKFEVAVALEIEKVKESLGGVIPGNISCNIRRKYNMGRFGRRDTDILSMQGYSEHSNYNNINKRVSLKGLSEGNFDELVAKAVNKYKELVEELAKVKSLAEQKIAEKKDACNKIKEEFGADSVVSKDFNYIIEFNKYTLVVRKRDKRVEQIQFKNKAILSIDYIEMLGKILN